MSRVRPQAGHRIAVAAAAAATRAIVSVGGGTALLALVLMAVPAPAPAQVVTTASQDLNCLGTRASATLGCTAGDLTATAVLSATAGTPLFCQAGQSFNFDADVQISKSAGNTRYDVGFFTGQSGNSPIINDASKQCSVAIFPFTAPFSNQDSDACADISGSQNFPAKVQNIKVTCIGASGTDSNLSVPFALSWHQNTSFTCAGVGVAGADTPANGAVYTDTSPKCSSGTATVSVNATNLQVGGYVDVIKQTLPDTDAQTFSYTATGPAGTMVGYQMLTAGGVPTGSVITNNNNAVTFTLGDATSATGPGVRVFINVVSANRTLTITEQPSGQVAHWQSAASISCAAVTGSPTLTVNNANRQIQAALNTTNSAAKCTVTNTKRARIALVKNVAKRLDASDQFSVSVSGAGASTLTNSANAAILASAVTVTTSGAALGNYTNATNPTFRATPGQVLTLVDAKASGTSPLSSYTTALTCTNAFSGPGATAGLPSGLATSSYDLTPAPGDDITCTYTNTAKAKLTLAKVVVNDDGQTKTAADFTLTATGPTTISGISGAGAVTGAVVPTGTYTLSETSPVGYVQTGLACSGAADTDPSNGLALAAGEIATCTFTNNDQPIGQTVVKGATLDIDADGSGTITKGDTLRYTVTVTNTGSVALNNVQITDPRPTPGSKTCATVAPAATCVLTGTYVVTQADETAGNVTNTASVTSTEIPGPVSSNTLVTPVLPPAPAALAVAKSHTGDFSAGANATYTLQVSNTGGTAVSGTTTVTDTLATGLTFVSGTGTNWSCGAVGQAVTCTSSASVNPYSSMAPITLTVAVAASAGSTVANQASVANPNINGGTPAPGNTDNATILHADLSTSTKTVVNLGGGSTGDVDAGDVLEYTINLIETAGAVANNVHVTDTVQAGLGSVFVSVLPAGATDNTSGNVVDVSGITVPAGGTVQLKFRATIGGGFSPGDGIDNVASVDNPAGPDATPAAPTLTYAQSQVVVSGGKQLYLRDDNGSPTAQVMDRDRPTPGTTAGTTLVSKGGSIVWTQSPVIPAGETLELDAGTVVASLPINTGFEFLDLQVFLYRNGTSGTLIGQSTMRSVATSNAVSQENFAITLNGSYAPLQPGQYLTLQIVNSTSGNGKNATVYAYNGAAATLSFSTSTVVHVDSVDHYSQPYASGNATASYYVLGGNVYLRAVASDPFGGSDVGSAEITITDANGDPVVGPVAMTPVATATATRTFEYALSLPQQGALGSWTASVTAYEGEEATVTHTAAGAFPVRGKVTLDQAWGAGATAGDAVTLQVTGGTNAVDGSSTAPGPATPATADATGSSTITLVQAFTSGIAGHYTITLSCVRDADASGVTVSGTGLSRTIQMPLDSSVTCTWNDDVTVPLTIVKLLLVRSDPINGEDHPKAIPGAIIEYQLVVTNPSATALDADTLAITDPLPDHVEMSAVDLGGVGSGPVIFSEGDSGLTYVYPDDIEFSRDHGDNWDYEPDPDVDGMDPEITDIRISPSGSFNGNNAQFTLRFHVRVK